MIIDRPCFDRDRVLKEEARQRRVTQRIRQMTAALAPDECLGEPVREEDRFIIPIERRRERGPVPARRRSTLVAVNNL